MSSDTESRQRRVGEDVTVALHRPAELFSVRPEAMLERDARIEPGADEIVNELLGRSRLQRRHGPPSACWRIRTTYPLTPGQIGCDNIDEYYDPNSVF
jgi:hypothetical protein